MKKQKMKHLAALGLTVLIFSRATLAQDAAPKPRPKEPAAAADAPTVLRAYDVRDLLIAVNDYPVKGPLVPPGTSDAVAVALLAAKTGLSSSVDQAPGFSSAPIDHLKKLLTDTVDTSGWVENGGSTGLISILNGQLFITQTEQNHKAIVGVLNELRKGRSHMVRIRADWMLLAPGQLAKVLKRGDGDTAALPEINRDALLGLPQDVVHYTGQISCFNGQLVHLASGRARRVITSVTPVVAPSAIAMEPTTVFTHFGVSLEVTPTLGTDSATLDLSSIVSQPDAAPSVPSTQPATPEIDRNNAVIQEFHTTVQVPLNTPVLIGGSTADPASDQPAGKQLYLVIEADTGK